MMDYSRLRNNKFNSKKEFEQALLTILEPLNTLYHNSLVGQLNIGYSGTVYDKKRKNIEAFLRPLWGLGPYFSGNRSSNKWKEFYLIGIIEGTDPQSENYWGQVEDYDQLIVEMTSIASMIVIAKENTWDQLSTKEQENLYLWLIQVNKKEIAKNNWILFRTLINTAMMNVGMPYSEAHIIAGFKLMDSFYLGNGWYYDGKETQIDYYDTFTIHYYSLIYYSIMKDQDPKRCEVIKERAVLFAQTFKYWFDRKGEALPFGRSLTYRFAQVAFWSALVVANIEALPWGEIKGIISRNLANWLKQDIFTVDGRLSFGYHYENLMMNEGYNGPGSPYWALKSFIILSIDDKHPFWKATTIDLQLEKNTYLIKEARMLLKHSDNELVAYPAGQFIKAQNHDAAKYSKFAYSTKYGFSVPVSNHTYEEGGFDNTLALSEDDRFYCCKTETLVFELLDDRVIHLWQPYYDVIVKSTIIPFEAGHIRVHEIQTHRELFIREAGFSTKYQSKRLMKEIDNGLSYEKIIIQNIWGYLDKELVLNSPNTNLFYPVTAMPVLKGRLKVGNHLLISVINHVVEDLNEFVEITDKQIEFRLNDHKLKVTRSAYF